MEKIFEIASSINNPYALVALVYLILFVLFKGVLAKVGIQAGKSGFKIIMRFMSLVAGIAVFAVLAVFGFKTYEVYAGTKVVANDVNAHTDAALVKMKSPDLQVDFSVSEYSGANAWLSNQGQGTILVSDITLNWSYEKCPEFKKPSMGSALATYQYTVDLTASDGSQVLKLGQEFKYGPGEVDKFSVDLNYPDDLGIYTIWVSFIYKNFGEQSFQTYETDHIPQERCVQY